MTDILAKVLEAMRPTGRHGRANGSRRQLHLRTLELKRATCNDLKAKNKKLLDHAERLLGLCTLSGFTTLLPKTTGKNNPGLVQKGLLCAAAVALFVVVILAVKAIRSAVERSRADTISFPDITDQEQAQSVDSEELVSLIDEWNARIVKLETVNDSYSKSVKCMYLLYAVGLELIIISLFPSLFSFR
ncbi:hypothetical protein CI603_06320 [Bifidobacterium sp. wkB338]|uniref:hypothetical protein n=1 Tax=Bifidobacterium sp. wkB338 TaxID=2025114 RepID=UPI000EF9D3CD|nr:hypothetical protein [Bifidobacterium sp. wkB338]RMA45459.1 hypothetical protein CI603_06320 [Bifidobacterium sp. wkB338]